MQYQSDYILRIIEQMGSVLREAMKRHRGGASSEEPLELANEAIGLVVDMDPSLFLRLSPPSMVALVELSGFDDRLVTKLAEAISFQADVLEGQGSFIEAGVRREQAAALLNAIDPSHAN